MELVSPVPEPYDMRRPQILLRLQPTTWHSRRHQLTPGMFTQRLNHYRYMLICLES